MAPRYILGISAYYHDSAAALLADGRILAAAQEERFSRRKHDSAFPERAVRYVLHEAGITHWDRVEATAFYDKPYLKFERLLETYHAFAPRGLKSFLSAMPVWIKEKLFTRRLLQQELTGIVPGKPRLLFPEHHLSHAASAFFPSPFSEAAILTVDGVGEWATATIGHADDNCVRVLRQLDFPHSVGLLYSAFTYYCGFKVNSGEYKLMGLAPYGDPDSDEYEAFKRVILDELVDLRDDGSLLLNMDCFNFATGLTMCNDAEWERLFGLPPRAPETELGRSYMNLALAIQKVTEEIVLRMARTAKTLTNSSRLVLAGGVALNCVANGVLLKSRIFDDIWIQPAAGDAGGALGAAYAGRHIWLNLPRDPINSRDSMQGAYLGPEFGPKEIRRLALSLGAPFEEIGDYDRLCRLTAERIAAGKVVGWFQGRMEYGPRALGNRSILADPRQPEMQKKLNLKVKFREGFRPFAPSVIEEDLGEYFDLDRPSPYMLLVAPVRADRRRPLPEGYRELEMYQRLYTPRSDIPAVTHLDYSARVQSVDRTTNEKYWKLLQAFKELTGCGVLVNTSFNVRGEPIVCSPEDAYRCFMRTGMDFLVMDRMVFDKAEQPEWTEQEYGPERFEID